MSDFYMAMIISLELSIIAYALKELELNVKSFDGNFPNLLSS